MSSLRRQGSILILAFCYLYELILAFAGMTWFIEHLDLYLIVTKDGYD